MPSEATGSPRRLSRGTVYKVPRHQRTGRIIKLCIPARLVDAAITQSPARFNREFDPGRIAVGKQPPEMAREIAAARTSCDRLGAGRNSSAASRATARSARAGPRPSPAGACARSGDIRRALRRRGALVRRLRYVDRQRDRQRDGRPWSNHRGRMAPYVLSRSGPFRILGLSSSARRAGEAPASAVGKAALR